MANGRGPRLSEGAEYRYTVGRGSEWTVDDARSRTRIAWLTIGGVFSGLFAGFMILAFILGGEAWTLITAGFLFCAMLVCVFLVLQIKSAPATGVFFKEFHVRPVTMEKLLDRAVKAMKEELVPVKADRTRFMNDRYWDVHSSYQIKGRGTRVNIIRKFKLGWTSVNVRTFLEMGPKGGEEDEFIERLTSLIDSENIYGPEDATVSFTGMEEKYRTRLGVKAVGSIVNVVAFTFYMAYLVGLVPSGERGLYSFDYTLVFLALIASVIVVMWARIGILEMARQVTAVE